MSLSHYPIAAAIRNQQLCKTMQREREVITTSRKVTSESLSQNTSKDENVKALVPTEHTWID
jgi:flagellar biosynthesis regulator FlaF